MTALTHEKRWVLRQAVYGRLLERIDGLFGRHAVAYMPIKGAWLICSGLAERLSERAMDDIDLLVRPDDFDRAAALVAASSEATEVHSSWPFEREFMWRAAGFTMHVEIHRAINYDERFRLTADELFERAGERRGQRLLPTAEDALAILICHKLVHVVASFDQRGIEEIVLLVTCPDFRWERFWQIADSAGVRSFATLVLRYVALETGISVPFGTQRMPYVDLLVRLVPWRRYDTLPRLCRRMLLEAPFVRDPVGLLVQRFHARKALPARHSLRTAERASR
jgi:hypothetical protein